MNRFFQSNAHTLFRGHTRSLASRTLLLASLALLASCGPNRPDASQATTFTDRALTQDRNGLTVRASVLSDDETRRYFGGSTSDASIQPVWIQVQNNTDSAVRYLPILTDPAYYAPLEVAQQLHGWFSNDANQAVDTAFESNAMPNFIAAHQTAAGFVYTHEDGGLKFLNIALLGSGKPSFFRFVVPIRGVQYAVQNVDFSKLYPPDKIEDLSLDQLRSRLETLSCCVTNKAGSAHGDPLNLVIVGNGVDAIFPFTGRGWRLNEPVNFASSFRMAKAFVLRSPYETAPVSPLFLFDRYQDVALQKARSSVSQRNHLRLWLAPFTVEGRKVWIGQISRDIGVKLTTKSWSLTTHRIGAYVDQERDYLLQDLLLTGFVDRFGYVKGVGESSPGHARVNLTDDPYYTDGLRLVLFLGPELSPPLQVQFLDWERAAAAK
jgi:LssY C-terminus